MTKSPLAFVQKAFEVARAALPAYSSKFPRKDFTRHQLFALLALKTFLETDYRGVVEQLRDGSDLREALGLPKVPHVTTIHKAAARLKEKRPTLS